MCVKIIHIVNEGLFGGVLRVSLAESHYLNEMGFASYILLLYRTWLPSKVLRRYYKAKLMYLKENTFPSSLQHFINPVFRELLGMCLTKIKMLWRDVDYVILHNLNALPLAKYIKHNTHAKIALYVHNSTTPPSFRRLLRSFIKLGGNSETPYDFVSDIDVFVTSSHKMRDYIRRVFGVDAYVVPPGCDPAKNVVRDKMRYVLVPQRLSIGKRVHVVARLLSRCRSSFLTVFAGSTHHTTARVLRRIGKSGLRYYLVAMNPDEEELVWLYRHALCSVSIVGEPFGMYILEAASQGTAVIAPRDAGASELFTHMVHGLFFKHEEELSEYVDYLVSYPELAKKMGFEAWKLCREKYTWRHHVEALVEILRRNV